MDRRVMFLLFLFLLISAAPSADVSTTAENEVLSFNLSQTEMGIYRWITQDVNESEALSKALDLFNLRSSQVPEMDGIYFVQSGNKTFSLNTRDGSMWYGDYDHLWNVASGVEVPTPEMSKSVDPLNPQLDDCYNDHLPGFGYVSSDPDPGERLYLVYITNPC